MGRKLRLLSGAVLWLCASAGASPTYFASGEISWPAPAVGAGPLANPADVARAGTWMVQSSPVSTISISGEIRENLTRVAPGLFRDERPQLGFNVGDLKSLSDVSVVFQADNSYTHIIKKVGDQ